MCDVEGSWAEGCLFCCVKFNWLIKFFVKKHCIKNIL